MVEGIGGAVMAAADPGIGWGAARPRTLVDHAVDVILSAAARGLILPGDRVSEPELAAHLGMSRVPSPGGPADPWRARAW